MRLYFTLLLIFALTVVNGQTFSGSVGNITDDGQPNNFNLIVNDVTTLSKGTYLINIISENNNIIKKLVID